MERALGTAGAGMEGMGRGVMECPMSRHVARILLGGGGTRGH